MLTRYDVAPRELDAWRYPHFGQAMFDNFREQEPHVKHTTLCLPKLQSLKFPPVYLCVMIARDKIR